MVVEGKEVANGRERKTFGIRALQMYERMRGAANQGHHVSEIRIRPRNNGIRNTRWGARRDSDPSNYGFQAAFAGALERYRRRCKQLVAVLRGESGQSTVEFAVVAAAFLAVMFALSALWHALANGLLVEHALAVASHHIQAVAPVTVVDIFLY